MELKQILCGQVIDSNSMAFKAVVSKDKRTVSFFHALFHCFLDQTNIQFGTICSKDSFVKKTKCCVYLAVAFSEC